jgi:Domain of unknown function (DUF4136)
MQRAVLLLMFSAVGCASMGIHAEVAPEANLAAYHGYAWLPVGDGHEPTSIIDQQVRAALRQELARKGLAEVAAAGTPDLLVGYHVLEEHKVAVTDWGNGIYGWAPEVRAYTAGTLIVDFIDPHSNRVIWRVSASHAIEPPGLVDVARLRKAAQQMAARYPAPVSSAAPSRL